MWNACLHSRTFVVWAMACTMWVLLPGVVNAQVLGACGTPSEQSAAAGPAESAEATVSSRMPLPGEHAINFELPAVVGDEIKMVKLSDFNGKLRVVCFYPADFTFV
ncbi:MAG: redoxin domain-containing protein [Deltaproteobacteria bacterium]|nr:redoxin domain-containing protein [Deltaproteobacteria bacterium]